MKRCSPRNLVAALLAFLIVVVVQTAPGLAQSCPAGMRPTQDGHCLAANQTYCGSGKACSDGLQCRTSGSQAGRCFYANGCFPGQVRHASGGCVPVGYIACSDGSLCRTGETCAADNKCAGGPPPTGPYTPSGKRCGEGERVHPNGGCYNPAFQQICGQEMCDVRAACDAANSQCLSPFMQVNATPQVRVPGPPTVTAPPVRTPGSPNVTPPTVRTPDPTVTPPTVRAPGSPTVTVPEVRVPTPTAP
jgi:hypothetical protein